MPVSDIEISDLVRRNFWRQALKEHVAYVKEHSPYYKEALKWAGPLGLDSDDLLSQLPFTEKDDLARNNLSFLCVPLKEVTDIVTTSGTLGDPVALYLTDSDLDRLARNEAGSYRLAGTDADDTFQLMTTIDKRFMAGLAYFLGVRQLGARIIRCGPGAAQLQWDSIMRFKPTVLIAVPSFMLALLRYAHGAGIDPNSSSVKKILCIGEPVRDGLLNKNPLAERITEQWNVQLFSTYASTEMSTAFTECGEGRGAHLQPELMMLEVLNDDGVQVKDGEAGEVVATPLGVQGMPLIRFRTGDICHYYDGPCACGRNTPRLGPVVGRKQQLIKFKGTSIYPNAIIDELTAMPEVGEFVVELNSDEVGLDEVVIRCHLQNEALGILILDRLSSKLRVRPRLVDTPKDEIIKVKFSEKQRKPRLLIDNRQKDY